jgi:hypothetical protein
MIIPSTQDTGVLVLAGAQTAVNFAFPVYAAADLEVWYYDAALAAWRTSALVLNTDYTVVLDTPLSLPCGGVLTLLTGASANDKIRISGISPEEQSTQFVSGGPAPALTIEKQLADSLVIYAQRLRRDLGRTALLPRTSTNQLALQDPVASDDGKFLVLDWATKTLKLVSAVNAGQIAVTSYMATLLLAADAAAARALLSVADPATFLLLAGGTMAGDLDMAAHKIENLPGPSSDLDAATKKYVDDNAAVLTAYARSGTPVSVTNTVTETQIIAFTVHANDLGTLNHLMLRMIFKSKKSGTPTCTLRFKYGGTTFATLALKDFIGDDRVGVVEASLMAHAAANAQIGMAMSLHAKTIATVTDAWVALSKDSTADQTFLVTAQWDAANSGNDFAMEGYTALLVR